MSRITLAREYPDDRDVIAQICKLKSRTSATEKETSQIEQHLNNTDQRVTTLETVTQGLTPEDIETVKTVADDVQQLESEVTALDGRVDTLETERASDRQYIEAVAEDVSELGTAIPNTYATKSALQNVSTDLGTTQTQLTNLANEIHTDYVTLGTSQIITGLKAFTGQEFTIGDRPSKAFKSNYITRGTLPTYEADCTIDEYDSQDNRMAFINMGQNTTGDGFIVFLAADYQGNGDRAVLRTNKNNGGIASSYLEVPFKGKPSSASAVPLSFVSENGENKANNLVHTEGLENITGIKRFNAPLQVKSDQWSARTDYKSSGYTAMDINFIVANNDAIAKLRFFETATERGIQVGVWSNALNDMSWTTIGRVVK